MEVTIMRLLWETGQSEQKRENKKHSEKLQNFSWSLGRLVGQR